MGAVNVAEKNDNGHNPLIHTDDRDTLQALRDYVGWICRTTDGDPDMDPGLLLALGHVRGGLEVLNQHAGGTTNT